MYGTLTACVFKGLQQKNYLLQLHEATVSPNLNPFHHILISFDTSWKHQKTKGSLMFSGGIKGDQWYEIG